MERRTELALLGAVLVAALVLRLWAPGADVPYEVERTHAVYMDAFWSLEAAAASLDTGSPPAHLEGYDLPVWTPLARTWFRLAGLSLGSVQALGGLCSFVTLLLVWRLLRGTLGPKPALFGAAALATLYPSVWLARSTLIYVPLSLAMTLAACLWLSARSSAREHEPGGRGSLWGRAQELLAWVLALACASLRPQCAALLVGLALGQSLRAGARLRRAGFVVCGAGALLGLGVLLSPGLRGEAIEALARFGGDLGVRTADRLQRYLSNDLGPRELLLRLLHWGGEPYRLHLGRELGFSRGNGYFPLAPGLVAAACCGAFLVWQGWGRMSARARELALVVGGWGATFVAGSLFVHYRPLRYFELLAVPGVVTSALAIALLRGERKRWTASSWALAAILAAFLGAHLANWSGFGPDLEQLSGLELSAMRGGEPWRAREAARMLGEQEFASWTSALLGAVLLLVALRLAGRLPVRQLTCAFVVLVISPSALALGRSLTRPTYELTRTRAEAAAVLQPGDFATGPLTSVLLLGRPVLRDRGAWFATRADILAQSCARLRDRGYTHFVLEARQATSAQLSERLATQGVQLTLERELLVRRPGQRWGPARFLILRIKIQE